MPPFLLWLLIQMQAAEDKTNLESRDELRETNKEKVQVEELELFIEHNGKDARGECIYGADVLAHQTHVLMVVEIWFKGGQLIEGVDGDARVVGMCNDTVQMKQRVVVDIVLSH